MQKLRIKKIALLGTSPIMILLYFRLKKKYLVDVYENSKIGGAWRLDQYDNESYSAHNNIIVALNGYEEKYIKSINKELSAFGCKKNKAKGKYSLITSYVPKKKFIHNISNLFDNFKKDCITLKKRKINNVKVYKKKVFLNNEEYDKVFFPSCFDVNKIHLNDLTIKINKIKSISHHLTIIYKQTKLPKISYTEDFDNIFDRAYFRNNKKKIFFTGRVRRNYKKFHTRKLIKLSNILNNTKENIIKIKRNKYCHNIIDQNVLNYLNLKLKNTSLKIIETKQFVRSYKLLNRLKF